MWIGDCCRTVVQPAVAAAGLGRVCSQMDGGTYSGRGKPAAMAVCGTEAGQVAAAPWGLSAGWGRAGSEPEILIVVQGQGAVGH